LKRKVMSEFITFLISFFLINPLQAEFSDKLAAARAPQAIVTQLSDCVVTATPALIERAFSDPWWAASSSFSVWTGQASPEAILVKAAPACGAAVEAARPFLAPSS
jgi:hypothetical protein